MRVICAIFATMFLFVVFSGAITVFADGEQDPAATTGEQTSEKLDPTSAKAIAAAAAVGLAAAAGALGMGITIAKSADSIARQPEASGKINSAMMLGLVFIETTIIYALVIAILIIFIL